MKAVEQDDSVVRHVVSDMKCQQDEFAHHGLCPCVFLEDYYGEKFHKAYCRSMDQNCVGDRECTSAGERVFPCRDTDGVDPACGHETSAETSPKPNVKTNANVMANMLVDFRYDSIDPSKLIETPAFKMQVPFPFVKLLCSMIECECYTLAYDKCHTFRR